MPGREQGTILASMTLRRCDVSDAAVPMFIVVPMDEGPGPLSCRVEFGETFDRNSGRYLAVRNNASAYGLSSLTRGRE